MYKERDAPLPARIFLVRISRDASHGSGETKDEEERKREDTSRDPDIPCRVGTTRGRHVTPNIGRKPKLITTDLHSTRNALIPHVLFSLRSRERTKSYTSGFATVGDGGHLLWSFFLPSFSTKRVSIPALSPSLCLLRRISASLPASPWETRSASNRVKENPPHGGGREGRSCSREEREGNA